MGGVQVTAHIGSLLLAGAWCSTSHSDSTRLALGCAADGGGAAGAGAGGGAGEDEDEDDLETGLQQTGIEFKVAQCCCHRRC